MKNKTPKTWNELLNAKYVIELTEEQIGIAKHTLNPVPEFSYANNDHINPGFKAEEKMRKKSKKC